MAFGKFLSRDTAGSPEWASFRIFQQNISFVDSQRPPPPPSIRSVHTVTWLQHWKRKGVEMGKLEIKKSHAYNETGLFWGVSQLPLSPIVWITFNNSEKLSQNYHCSVYSGTLHHCLANYESCRAPVECSYARIISKNIRFEETLRQKDRNTEVLLFT